MPFWTSANRAGAAAADVSDQALAALVATLRAPLADAQRDQLVRYVELLQRWNEVYNLTAITSTTELVRRHLSECLALGGLLGGTRIADLGTGAGLPGLVLALANPGREFWLLESVGKKTRFLTHVCGELALTNVQIYQGRIEDFPVSVPFDTVVARALAPLDRLVKLARPLLAQKGRLVALKGEGLEAELQRLPAGFKVAVRVLPAEPGVEPPPRAVIIVPDESD